MLQIIWLSAEMGTNAQRLMRRSVGILLYSNVLAVKVGSKQASTSGPSYWHQDGTDTPIDRASWVRFWIALDHITPDMGSINFIDRSHRLGPLGNKHLKAPEPNQVLFEKFPELKEYGAAGPFEFQPGDATVHGMYTVHGAPGNDTSKPRWGPSNDLFRRRYLFCAEFRRGLRLREGNKGRSGARKPFRRTTLSAGLRAHCNLE